ncbi:MAG TPA: NUDIX hydrolase [Methylomirabilota bacterium]|nr:NUDIX hydrolase [Methylomirabilota bacterium]
MSGKPSGIEPWRIVESTWILRSAFMDIRRDRCRKVDGPRTRDYLALDLKDFSVVVALTPAREVLLCREYKHGARGLMYTLPAGFIEPGETPEQGARRELLEETGHAAAAFTPLGTFLLVPDLAAARGHVFLARDARAETTPHPDEDEEIEVETVPLDRATGHLEDASSLLAFQLARPHLL